MKLKRETAVQGRILWNIRIWYDSQVADEIKVENQCLLVHGFIFMQSL